MKKEYFMAHSITFLLFVALFLSLWIPLLSTEPYQAATSYTNAKEFYESTALDGENYHAEIINGTIYYATSAKLASSSSNLRYHTVGFDIELSGNGHSVSFTVQRTGGSMKEIDTHKDNTYEYILYAITDSTLFHLANISDPTAANYVLDASVIDVKMDAILVTKKGTEFRGGISEDGSGGFTHWGTIYRLKNVSDLSSLKQTFAGHTFTSYYDIHEKLLNYQLQLRYQLQGLNSTSSTTAAVGNGYTIMDGFLSQNGSHYIQTQRLLQPTTLLNPANIHLQKEGYHLENGSEWMTEDGRVFHATTTYMPQTIDPLVGTQDQERTMYANWKPNTYTITYDANGGIGTILPTTMIYDVSSSIAKNTFSRSGYYLPAGKEWIDANGTTYASSQTVCNLTSEQGAQVELKANWQPCVFSILTDQQGGVNGTNVFYEKYDTGFSLSPTFPDFIDHITTPSKTGFHFLGYYKGVQGFGPSLITADGAIHISNSYFDKDSIIYADWEEKTYTITLDKQGGTGGTDNVTVTYNKMLPVIDVPVKKGFSFKGYFTEPHGQGECYYGALSETPIHYKNDGDLTLYAYWIDETPPTITLNADYSTWTNRTITLTAHGEDYGVGLDAIKIYHETNLVAEISSLNGANIQDCVHLNATEGVINYKAVAIDQNGQTAEAYFTVYSDITNPKGLVIHEDNSSTVFDITVTVSDENIK